VALRLFHLLVSSCDDFVLGYHLDRLNNLVDKNRVLKDVLKGRDSLSRLFNWVDTEDVAADLVTELNAASLKSEESRVATLLLRGLHLNGEFECLASSNLITECNNLGLHIITACLDELSTSRPGGLTIVAHPPGLAEDITTDDFMLIREAFLDKASRVTDLLLRSGRLRALTLPCMILGIDVVVLRTSCSMCRW